MENSPVVTVNNGEDGAAPSVAGNPKTVRFQCGLLRETETFAEEDLQDVSLAALLEYVDEMLNIKVSDLRARVGWVTCSPASYFRVERECELVQLWPVCVLLLGPCMVNGGGQP